MSDKARFTTICGLWKRRNGKKGLTGKCDMAVPIVINPNHTFFVDENTSENKKPGHPDYHLKVVLDVDPEGAV